MRSLVRMQQALVSAPGRRPNGGTGATKSRFREAKISYGDLPKIRDSDPKAFIKLHSELEPRQVDESNTYVSTCGYLNGNASLPRTADPGFDCRVDTKNAVWGVCPTTVLAVSDCGLAGACWDAHPCTDGCGISGDPAVRTLTCTNSGADYCSTALLTDGPDQTYSYIACGKAAITDNLLNLPTVTVLQSSTLSTTLSRVKASITSASSTPSATASTFISTPLITTVVSSAPASRSTLSKAVPSPSDNTGVIVGGVLGGLALLTFVVMTIFFYRRLRMSPTKAAHGHDSVWQDIGSQRAILEKAPNHPVYLAELPSDKDSAELSSGRRDETTELPSNMKETGRS